MKYIEKINRKRLEEEKKINRKFAGKKANITKEYNQKIKKLLNNQISKNN